ncbi:MAG: RagB/SusD family nutrient uptake outer membrane protein [Bacteroidales bacterium]|nr:RagB/SusD family nutrient uptake outer membrane protein [Bacteroidales bacterium]
MCFIQYFDYYNNPTSPIIAYYAPAWATDADIAAWRADDPYGQKANTIITKTTLENVGIGPSTQVNATWKERRSMDLGVPCIKKFDDYTAASIANRSSSCSTHDVVLSRLGEAYLIAAEAYLQCNDRLKAADMINKLRQRPGTVKTGFEAAMNVTAGDITIDFILDERAREMAGEYVRYTDLKRTHKLVEYVTAYNEDGVTDAQMKGDDGKYKILRPIPQDALDKNQTKVAQNPGY